MGNRLQDIYFQLMYFSDLCTVYMYGAARLTTSYCAPSREPTTFMQNRVAHHLISTKLHCAPWCTTQVGEAPRTEAFVLSIQKVVELHWMSSSS